MDVLITSRWTLPTTLRDRWSGPGVAVVVAVAGVIGALVFGALVASGRPVPHAASVALATAVATVAAAVDVRERRLPDRLVVAVAVSAVLPAIAAGHAVAVAPAVFAGAALMGIPLFTVHLVHPAAMGFGDVKFATALGATVGAVAWQWSLVALCVASGLSAAAGIARRQRDVPFGPGLVAGTVAALAIAAFTDDAPGAAFGAATGAVAAAVVGGVLSGGVLSWC